MRIEIALLAVAVSLLPVSSAAIVLLIVFGASGEWLWIGELAIVIAYLAGVLGWLIRRRRAKGYGRSRGS